MAGDSARSSDVLDVHDILVTPFGTGSSTDHAGRWLQRMKSPLQPLLPLTYDEK